MFTIYFPRDSDDLCTDLSGTTMRLFFTTFPHRHFILYYNRISRYCSVLRTKIPGILCTHDIHGRLPSTAATDTRLESYRNVKFGHPEEPAHVWRSDGLLLNAFFIVGRGINWLRGRGNGTNYSVIRPLRVWSNARRNQTMDCNTKTKSGSLQTLINEKPSANAILRD